MSNSQQQLIKFLLGMGLTVSPHLLHAQPSLTEVRDSLTKTDKQVLELNSQLNQNSSQKANLKHELSTNQKKINANQIEAQNIRQKIQALQTDIQAIRSKIQTSEQNIASLKPSIQEHLNLHLRLEQQPLWQLALSAKNPFEYQQELELIAYLHLNEQNQLNNLNRANLALKEDKQKIIQQKKSLKQYELSLLAENQKIQQTNLNHLKTIEKIQAQIENQTETLVILKKHQASLKNLIQHLIQESTLQSHRPFSNLKRNLNSPIYQNLPQALNLDHGLLFPAPPNTPIYAVSTGKIVFSDWLNGYGYLIILDHGWGFMSLYANNSELLKHKGDMVKQGEIIAKSGDSGAFKKQGLYFEIRQRTKVISARAWFKTHMA